MSPDKIPFRVREDGCGWAEEVGKTIGSTPMHSPAAALRWNNTMLRLSPICGRWFPGGVFKFKTWEEEAQWTRQQISQAIKRLK